MNSIKNTSKSLIASTLLVILQIFLTYSALSQPIQIKMQFRGDTIAIDTAVVMSLTTYRNIRERIALLQAKDSLNVELDANAESIIMKINAKNDHLMQTIDELYVMLARREQVIDNLEYSIRKMEGINIETLNSFERYVEYDKKLWRSPFTWGALALGFVGGVLIAK